MSRFRQLIVVMVLGSLRLSYSEADEPSRVEPTKSSYSVKARTKLSLNNCNLQMCSDGLHFWVSYPHKDECNHVSVFSIDSDSPLSDMPSFPLVRGVQRPSGLLTACTYGKKGEMIAVSDGKKLFGLKSVEKSDKREISPIDIKLAHGACGFLRCMNQQGQIAGCLAAHQQGSNSLYLQILSNNGELGPCLEVELEGKDLRMQCVASHFHNVIAICLVTGEGNSASNTLGVLSLDEKQNTIKQTRFIKMPIQHEGRVTALSQFGSSVVATLESSALLVTDIETTKSTLISTNFQSSATSIAQFGSGHLAVMTNDDAQIGNLYVTRIDKGKIATSGSRHSIGDKYITQIAGNSDGRFVAISPEGTIYYWKSLISAKEVK